ncbi:type II toxin-antitoxin system RelE/ParE family toxin [uncultured Sphingomonas sp.]|uniref:type II toxin-antitoxin system RelE/ParE family toxin n=1 Tax=uncultured Sphingomonas sp. TaxID=158754 RepID=UPI0035CA41A8
MPWTVFYHDAFLLEMEALDESVQEGLLTMVELLTLSGPSLGRPHADTLAGSKYASMKELRFRADDGVWRVAFAFDPLRQGIVLVAGDKSGVAQKRFYKRLIARADARFAEHLDSLKDD